ncbi:N-methyl-L-tryptophan oxidase [Salicibibacter cibarius]|uniref:N-methyl-L-tryptophan oxidase n=1 Tax=Salicibibacter cibarius TaxID=2743000 RepID=A0A7T7CAQ9_9BACI|nr:N-methyl-L-tryptophan oxidase [Salicibibacter cibarius]QQK74974.1 N-methyl-L-tryptophan oxidase [Salicibibacter cibarius]
MDADVAVIGVGSMGSSAFWQLASLGANVLGFERYAPGHDKGAGHGETRIFRTAYGEGTEYVPFLQESKQLWRHLETETDTDIYSEIGRINIGEKEALKKDISGAKLYQLPYELLDAKEAAARFPQHRFEENDMIYVDPQAGFVRPELAIQSATQRAIELGAKLYCGVSVTAIEPDDAGVTIYCGEERFRVGHVVVSAGAWASKLLPQLSLPVWVERQILVWYRAKNPDVFSMEKFPIFGRETEGQRWYGFPSLDGHLVKVAFHHGGDEVDPDTIDRTTHKEDIEHLSKFIHKYIPDLDPNAVKAKVCMYTNTPDNHFIIGSVSGMPNVTMLGPMAGHGFKFAPIMGKLAAEVATELTPTMNIDMFRPDRLIRV